MFFSEGKIWYWGTSKNVCGRLKEIEFVLENNYSERIGGWRIVYVKYEWDHEVKMSCLTPSEEKSDIK